MQRIIKNRMQKNLLNLRGFQIQLKILSSIFLTEYFYSHNWNQVIYMDECLCMMQKFKFRFR
ncbi:unnamed protein product [Paramecium sonneborni]|uniref:Uncharacterized protein n=1 Tax=Paramecium sonneborni TaxID=65129 RepID=A0A8S1KQH8_9CILI|nr:unnamed protein product [Paramecium sonneborni]